MNTIYALLIILPFIGITSLALAAYFNNLGMKKLEQSRMIRPKLSYIKQQMLESDYEKLLEEINKNENELMVS